jgi:lysyl-tRNA synthetase class 1
VRAWYEGDLIKTVHVLIPQVECGLRGIVAKLGQPVTKAHPTVAGVGIAVGMGDILNADAVREALGPDLTLHFLALYSDPRGFNLRNTVAHGLVRQSAINTSLVRLLILTLLIFGVWKELAAARR